MSAVPSADPSGRSVAALGPADLTASLRSELVRIYDAAFPPSERENPDAILQVDDGRSIFVARNERGGVLGFASVLRISDDAALLEYLAVSTLVRGGGIGGYLLDQVLAAQQRLGHTVVLMELEVPGAPGASDFAERRIGFYERHGCERIGWLPDYWIPDYSNPGGRLPMLLYWKRFDDRPATSDPTLIADLFRRTYPQVAVEDVPPVSG